MGERSLDIQNIKAAHLSSPVNNYFSPDDSPFLG
jgi:hypothetical protein